MHRYHSIIPNSDSMGFNLILKGNSKEIYVQSSKDSTEHQSLQDVFTHLTKHDAVIYYSLSEGAFSLVLLLCFVNLTQLRSSGKEFVCCSSCQHEPGRTRPKNKADSYDSQLYSEHQAIYTLWVKKSQLSRVYNHKKKPHVAKTCFL